jgi:hypothetical protein
MHTKLTLRIDEELVKRAKAEARRRGKSVSQMTADFIQSLDRRGAPKKSLPPITSSLLGVLRGRGVSELEYKRHLREKYLEDHS